MTKDIEFILDEKKLKRLRAHQKIKHRKRITDSSHCPACLNEFKIGEIILRTGPKYIHKRCLDKYRFDSPDEPELEEEIDRTIIINPYMLSNIEKLRISKQQSIKR